MSRATCGADLGLNQGSRPTRACKVKNVLDSNQNQGQDQAPNQNRERSQAQAQGQIQGPSGNNRTSTNANISNFRKRKNLVRTSDRLRIKQRREEQTRKAKAALRLETHGVLHRDIAIEYGNSANINHKALFLNRLGLRPKSGPRILEYQRVHFKPESLKSIANAVYAMHRVGLGFGKSAISNNTHNNNTNRVRCPKVVEVDLTGCSDDDEDTTKTNNNVNSSSSHCNSIDLKLSHAASASNHSRDLTHNVFHQAADTSRRKGGGGNVALVPGPGLLSAPSINPNSIFKSLPNKLRRVGVGTVVSKEVNGSMSPRARQLQQQQLSQQSHYSKNNQPTQTQTMQKQMPGLVVVQKQKQHPSSISSVAPPRVLPPVSLNLETNSDAWHQKLNKLRNNINKNINNTNFNLQDSMTIAGVQNLRGSQNQFQFKESHPTSHLGMKLPNQSVSVPVPKTSPHPKLTPKPQRVQIGPISNLCRQRQHLPVSSTIHHHAIVNANAGVGAPSTKVNSSPIHRLPNRPVRPVRNRNVPAPAPVLAPAPDPVRVSALQTPLAARKFSSPHEANDIQIVDLSSSDDDNDEHTEQRKDNLDQIRNRLLAMDTDLSFID